MSSFLPLAESFETETLALFARFSAQPTDARARTINALIRGLKADGLWAKCHVLFLFAAADAQAARLNWIGNVHNATLSGAPTFTADRGYAGGASAALATDYQPSAHGALNSASLGVWSRTVASNAFQMAGATNGVAFFDLYPRHTSNVSAGALNQAADISTGSSDGSGSFLISRRASNDVELYRNGATIQTGTNASTSLVTTPIYFAGFNDQSTIQGNSGQCAAGWIGSGLSDAEALALHTHLAAYMTAVGA